MRSMIIAASLIASVLAGAVSASAAERAAHFDGAKFFADVANRATQ